MIEFNSNDPIDNTQIRCLNCGYELAEARAPFRCPQCGAILQRSGRGGRFSLGEKLFMLNAFALVLAFQTAFPSKHHGFGWFPFGGAGPGPLAICIVMPLQVGVALWAFLAYVSRDATDNVGRFGGLTAIGPFILAAASFAAMIWNR